MANILFEKVITPGMLIFFTVISFQEHGHQHKEYSCLINYGYREAIMGTATCCSLRKCDILSIQKRMK